MIGLRMHPEFSFKMPENMQKGLVIHLSNLQDFKHHFNDEDLRSQRA